MSATSPAGPRASQSVRGSQRMHKCHRVRPTGRPVPVESRNLVRNPGTSPTSSEQVDGGKWDAHSTLPDSVHWSSGNQRNSAILAHSYGASSGRKAVSATAHAYAPCLFLAYFNGLSHRRSACRLRQEAS